MKRNSRKSNQNITPKKATEITNTLCTRVQAGIISENLLIEPRRIACLLHQEKQISKKENMQ